MKLGIRLILIILLGNASIAFAQKDSSYIAKNTVYIEFGGIGGYGSINYERQFASKSFFKLFGRIGLSTYNLKDYENNFNPDLIIPMSLNACFGNEHNFEFGAGPTFSRIVKVQDELGLGLDINFNLGYRYQKVAGGLLFRCGYTPIIEISNYGNMTFRHWAGISIGYAF